MFGEKEVKKSLILVYNEETKEYASLLEQLISAGKKEKVIVTKYSIKEYLDSKTSMTQNRYALIIGNSKDMKEETSEIDPRFQKYGMQYGWLGTTGVAYVNGVDIKSFDVKGFKQFVDEYDKKFEQQGAKTTDWNKLYMKMVAAPLVAIQPLVGSMAYKELLRIKYVCLMKILYLEALDKFLEA